MADIGIKQIRISKEELPPVDSDNSYTLRYRIISEDKNRVSHFSPMTSISANVIESVSGTLVKNGTYSTAVWGDASTHPKYDIFVSFDGGSYSYHGTSPTHTYSFLNTGTISVQVIVQIEGTSKTRSDTLKIFTSSLVSLV